MTSTALLRCYYWPARIKHRCPRKPFLIAWLSHCGFMGGSCRSAIHCFWRRNRLPLLLEVFGIHLSKADRRSTTISGRTYRGLPHVAWDTPIRSWFNQTPFEPGASRTGRNRLDDNLCSKKSVQREKSDSQGRNKGRTCAQRCD